MPERTEALKKAQQKYMGKFAIARVRMERERYERVQAHAEAQGESVNGFINRAIDNQISQDRHKDPCGGREDTPADKVVSLEDGQETAQNGVTAKED